MPQQNMCPGCTYSFKESEGVLAIEMGALSQDVALTIHPHPTLSETVEEVADIFLGGSTHMLPKKR